MVINFFNLKILMFEFLNIINFFINFEIVNVITNDYLLKILNFDFFEIKKNL